MNSVSCLCTVWGWHSRERLGLISLSMFMSSEDVKKMLRRLDLGSQENSCAMYRDRILEHWRMFRKKNNESRWKSVELNIKKGICWRCLISD